MNEDLKNLAKVLELIKELSENLEDSKKEEEETNEDYSKLEKLREEYNEMYGWAFSNNFYTIEDKRKLEKIWKEKHPKLPELCLPNSMHNNITNIILVMQVMPHWLEHKKRHNL